MEVRIDKWLWAVRVYKTRGLATEACRSGHITIDGNVLKPSRIVKIGDVIQIKINQMTRTLKVLALLEKRIGAKLMPEFVEDLTPESEYQKPREQSFQPFAFRPKGSGRPTKKDRRSLDQLEG